MSTKTGPVNTFSDYVLHSFLITSRLTSRVVGYCYQRMKHAEFETEEGQNVNTINSCDSLMTITRTSLAIWVKKMKGVHYIESDREFPTAMCLLDTNSPVLSTTENSSRLKSQQIRNSLDLFHLTLCRVKASYPDFHHQGCIGS